MTRLRAWIVRAVSRIVPSAYRDEVVTDLREEHRRLLPLLWALLRSGRDARRHSHRGEPREAGWHGLTTDIRGAWRLHRARPAGAVLIVLILALAIGLNTSIYSMVDAVLVRPLPFRDPGRVVFVWDTSPRLDMDSLTPARGLDLRERVTALEQAALIGHVSMTLTGRGPAERWFGASVSSSFFDVLGTAPALGTTFHAGDPDRDVIVLSHRFWVDRFGADPAIVGQRLVMNGAARTVLGVMPADFYWPSITAASTADNPPLFWTCAPNHEVPAGPSDDDDSIALNRSVSYLRMVARLRPDRAIEAAQLETDAVAAELGRRHPATDAGRGVRLVTADDQLFGAVRQPVWFILLASAFVVLGACVNVASLILVRQAGRRTELALRSALGAGRWRLTRQLIVESGLLAVAGGLAGAALAAAGVKTLVAIAPDSVGRLDNAGISLTVLAWTSAVTMLTGVILGGLSAIAVWRDRTAGDLRAAGPTGQARGRLRQGLVAIDVALAVALMVGAALFGQSLLRLQRVDVGLAPDHLLTFDISLTGERSISPESQVQFFDALMQGIRGVPGVQSAAGAVTLPIGGDDFGTSAFVDGRPLPPQGSERRIGFQIVGDEWFPTLGMRVLDGRDFDPADTRDRPPVVIVNQRLADLEWPGRSPVGERLRLSRRADAPALTVVGVVNNIHHLGPGQPPRAELYLPYHQMSLPRMAVAVRTTGEPMLAVPAIRAAVESLDAAQPISGIATMEEHLDRAYGRARFLAMLTVMFGAATLVLAALGVYGVTSFAVAQRTREFGVRTALGASPVRLGREVFAGSLPPVLWGAAAGVALAAATGRFISALLFGTAPLDPAAYVASVGVLFAAAGLAGLAPARRAAAVDPVTALRDG